MCGIAGIVDPGMTPRAEERLRAMLADLAHRGPDDDGILVEPAVALGHRRLSIIDLSAAGHQPMRFEHFELVFNGEIYNYRELRVELEGMGHRFVGDSDSEVLLHAWAQWGVEALSRFTGMWAFLLLDRRERTLIASRDPFGIKPLYLRQSASAWYFASEIRPLARLEPVPRADLARLADYLVVGVTDHCEATFFEGIRQVSPGGWLRVSLTDGTAHAGRYYDVTRGAYAAEPTAAGFADVLQRSVQLHMRSDVPVGTCLSGGLDSSVVAALASRAHAAASPGDRFNAVTARTPEAPQLDETRYAELVVRHLGLAWHIAAPTGADFARDIEACLDSQGEPVGGPSVFMQYQVFRTAKEHGLKVMLDGQGGDEALLGYERYFVAYLIDLIRRGEIRRAAREYRLLSRNSRLSFAQLTQYSLYFSVPSLRRWRLRRRAHFLVPAMFDSMAATLESMSGVFWRLRRLQELELERFCLPHLLRYEDRNSMRWSIEARVPFVTPAVMETALSLRAEDKIRDGFSKHVLRLLAERLVPREIAWRTNKFGFEAPTSLWLRQHATEVDSRIVSSPLIRQISRSPIQPQALGADMKWRLYNVAVWERQYGVTI
jgi:asparagine synthase (glutamine-hydrolysing)